MGFFDDMNSFLRDVQELNQQVDDLKAELLAPVTELIDDATQSVTELRETVDDAVMGDE